MNKKLKTALIILLILCIAFMPIVAFAHSGRTDSSGGHHDNKNKSGLGSYHYHCGGHPAHLHPNGVCPYATTVSTSSASSSATKTTTDPNAKTATITAGAVKINGNSIDNAKLEYPLISYNNATYFPMTWKNKNSLGITSTTDSSGIWFKTGFEPSYKPDVSGKCTPGKKITATKLDYTVWINGSCYNYDNQWPLLKYNDIVYIPLTYHFAEALNITTSWTKESGLSVNARNQSDINQKQNQHQETKNKQENQLITQQSTEKQTVKKNTLNKGSMYFVRAMDGSFQIIGEISSDFKSPYNILNKENGVYAESSLDTSIWNTFGIYGSYTSNYSAVNPNATYPPAISDMNGNLVGILSTNQNLNTEQYPTYTIAEIMKIFA